MIENPTSCYRGRMPGLYVPMENTQGMFASLDRSVTIDGKRYVAIKMHGSYSSNSGNCWFLFDGEWV